MSELPDTFIVDEEEGNQPRLNTVSKQFMADCTAEKKRLGDEFPLTALIIDQAFDRIQSTGRVPGKEVQADVFKQKLIKVSQKVFVPIKQFPNFNFIGKLLGPKGNSLRSLQEETHCRVMIKGRGSMRDSEREEELRQSGDPRHAHLNKDLYYEIQTLAPPAEAHARVAYALSEIRKYLVPDSNDEVSQNQREEILADPKFAQKAANFGQRAVGRQQSSNNAFNKQGVSIFKKLTGIADHSNDEEPEEGMKRTYQNSYAQKQSPYHKQRNNTGGNGYQGENKPNKSIWTKLIDVDEEEQDISPIVRQNAVSQRQPIKRQQPGRFLTPEKRSREYPFGGTSKTSKFSF